MDIKQRLKSLVNQFVIGMLPIFLFTVLSVTWWIIHHGLQQFL